MAIIQISRIQVRRGKENNGTDVPRLASGEFGWAVDTQRLFIGPGSEQEGSPDSLNNVRILTAKDNILSLVDQYQYKTVFDENGIEVSTTDAVPRSIQQRLDDFVSAASFGVVGDGLTDDTVSLQTAIDVLFSSNNDQSNRAVLYIPAGTYFTTAPLQIPSFAQIIGSGTENTIIINQNISSNDGSVFKTVGDLALTNSTDINQDTQSRYIKITDLSIEVNNGNATALSLISCRDSEFRNLKLSGTWTIDGDTNAQIAIQIESFSNAITSKNNVFENIEIENFAAGVASDGKILNNKFKNLNFYELEIGIVFDSEEDSPKYNIIENCQFDLIVQHGIHIIRGDYNTSKNNRFINVGNDGGNGNETPIIEFGDLDGIIADDDNNDIYRAIGNISVNDYFDRTEESSNPLLITKYLPEVQGRTNYENLFMIETIIESAPTGEPSNVFRLPLVKPGSIIIDYIFTDENIESGIRKGKFTILSTPDSDDLIIEDEFSSTGGAAFFDLEFSAVKETDYIMITAKNNSTNKKLSYTIKTKT